LKINTERNSKTTSI